MKWRSVFGITDGFIEAAFTVDLFPPDAPVLLAPVDGAITGNNTPTFDWSDVVDASGVTYQLQVTSGGFPDGPFIIDTGGLTQSEFTPSEPLPDDQYLWRVRAEDGAGRLGSLSDIFSVRVDIEPPTTPANLQELTAAEEVVREFTWERSTDPGFPVTGSGVDFYSIAITGPENLVLTADDSVTVCPADLCQFATPTLPPGIYIISVSAVDRALNESLVSATAEFTAGEAGTVRNPGVVDPVFATTVSTSSPKFRWNPPLALPLGLTTYEVSITADAQFTPFTDPVLFSVECIGSVTRTGSDCLAATGDTDEIQISLLVQLPDGTHLLRVRVVPILGPPDQPAQRTFTVDTTPPEPPDLVFPPNLPDPGAFINTPTPFFDWAVALGDVFDYRLQVVTSGAAFEAPFVIDEPGLTGTEFQSTVPLSQGQGIYQWRVIARDQTLNPAESATRSFRLDTLIVTPILVSPKPDEIVGIQRPKFEWVRAADDSPVTYNLKVSSVDITNGPFEIDITTTDGFFNPATDLPVAANLIQAYVWRVIATDKALNVALSAVRAFTINLNKPQAPIIVSPGDVTSNVSITPVFQWECVPLANYYDMEITVGDFPSDALTLAASRDIPHSGDASAIQSHTLAQLGLPTLAPGTLFRWRVRGKTKTGDAPQDPLTGLPSQVASFVTAGVPLELTLKVSLQGTGEIFGPVEFTVRLYSRDAFRPSIAAEPWRLFESTPVLTFTGEAPPKIDTGDRTFTLTLEGVAPGFYDIAIEANHTLVNLRDDEPVAQNTGVVDMGTLLAGNSIDDLRLGVEPASIINALDASLLAAAINEQVFDPRVDFNRDGKVDEADFALLQQNYLEFSPVLVIPP